MSSPVTPDPAEFPVPADVLDADVHSQEPEAKVVAATQTTGAVLGLIVGLLTALQATTGIMQAAPAWVVAVIGFAVAALTAGLTYWRSYAAPHTARPDLPASQR